MHEVATWIPALLSLVGLGFSLGLNPALYGATADMLARGSAVIPRLALMIGGLYIGATVLFVVLQSLNPTSFVHAVEGRLDAAATNRTVDLIAGAVFLVLALGVMVWALRVPERAQRTPSAPKTNSHLVTYFLIGLSSSVIGFTTLPIMYLTGRLVSEVSPHVPVRTFAYVVFLAALAAPFVVIAALWKRFPRLTDRVTAGYTRALQWDYRWPAVVISGVIGLALIVFAVTGRS